MDHAFLEFAEGGRPRLDLDKQRLTIGRSPISDLQLDDGTVSGQHAAMEWQPNGWTIEDLGSSNGTHVNGERIDQHWSLSPGDTVRLGHTELVFRIAPTAFSPESSTPAAGYLDMTEEWTPPTGPAQAREIAKQPTSTTPELRYGAQAGDAPPRLAVGNDPLVDRRNGRVAQIRGVARNVHRQTRDQTRVLVFRVERYDPSGNRLDPVGVEFRHYRSGGLNDGEEVEVIGSWKRGTLRARKVSNLTTHAEVLGPSAAAKFATRACTTIFLIIFVCFVLGIIIFAIASIG